MKRLFPLRVFLPALFVVGFIGCGGDNGPEIATVTGTVLLDGKPLPDAQVVFVPIEGTGGRPGSAKTDQDGKYQLTYSGKKKGAIPGKNRVRITTARPADEDDAGNSTPAVKETVPMIYNAKTTLEFTVEPRKENVADFDLKSKGPVREADPD